MAQFAQRFADQPTCLLKVNLDGAWKAKQWPEQRLQICHPMRILEISAPAQMAEPRLAQAHPAGPSAHQMAGQITQVWLMTDQQAAAFQPPQNAPRITTWGQSVSRESPR